MIIDKLHPTVRRYLAAAGENGSAEDRGDAWTPTEDDAEAAAGAAASEEERKPEKNAEKGKKEATAEGDADDLDPDNPDADDPEKDPKKKDTRMPLSRHKAILEKERAAREAAEAKVAQYQNGQRVAVINEDIQKAETKIAGLDEEYTKLITDGEHQKAAEKMREIRKLERELGDMKSDFRSQVASTQAVEKVRYDTAVERLEAAYPALNPDSDEHDAEVAQDVVDLAATYRTRGMTPADAIQKAAKKLLGQETKAQERATEVKPRVSEDDPEVKAEARRQEKEAERRQAQVRKNLDTSKKQPADLAKAGLDSDKAGGSPLDPRSVMKMSQDDFAKLDESTLARLRGDTFAGADA